ncbi:MAG: hypothetical protein HOI39_03150 [Flavobacteriales bacterium]|nr:hypothetical protein [Flavobacteriales bacterium]
MPRDYDYLRNKYQQLQGLLNTPIGQSQGGLLSNIPQGALLGSAIFGQGIQGKDPFSALLPAALQTAQLQKYMTPKDLRTTLQKNLEAAGLKKGTPEYNQALMQNVNPQKKERKIVKAADGFNYYEDTGERVLPDVIAKPSQPLISMEREKKYDELRGEQEATSYGKIQDAAETAQDNITNYEMVGALKQNINTGAFGSQLLNAAKFGKRLGVNTDWITKTDPNGNVSLRDGIANAETLEVLQVQFALEKIQKTKGAISDTEFKKFLDTSPGLSMTSDGIDTLTVVNKALARRDIKKAELASQWEAENGRLGNQAETEYGKMNFKSYMNKWAKDNPVVSDDFLKKMDEISQRGSELYSESNVFEVNGVLYRELRDGTTLRISGLK